MFPKSKHSIALILSLVISGGILAWLAIGMDWQMFFQQMRRVNLLYFPLIGLLYWLNFWLRAIRWKYLLPTDSGVKVQALYDSLILGLLATCILPFRAGELIRPWALSRTKAVSFSTGFASVVTERVFDVITVLILLGLCLSRLEQAPEYVVMGARALGGLAAAVTMLMLFAYLKPGAMLGFGKGFLNITIRNKYPELSETLERMGTEFVEGLRAISSFRELGLVVFWSAVLWLEVALEFQVALWAFGEWPSLWVGILINVIVALAIAAPSAPGFLGTFQLGCVGALSLIYGYPEEFAVAYSVVLHIFHFLLSILLGIFVLRRLGLSFNEISERSKGGGLATISSPSDS